MALTVDEICDMDYGAMIRDRRSNIWEFREEGGTFGEPTSAWFCDPEDLAWETLNAADVQDFTRAHGPFTRA